ncbi:MAG: DnaJ domain-containing protein [Thermoleophilia bacterium]|nr:DnaJ domain-containing protein [Thermoleophilia bacterium]
MDVRDAAAVLGVDPRHLAGGELSSAWRRFARANHPDRTPGDPMATTRFVRGRDAYETLAARLRVEDPIPSPPMRRPRVIPAARAAEATPYAFECFPHREWRA